MSRDIASPSAPCAPAPARARLLTAEEAALRVTGLRAWSAAAREQLAGTLSRCRSEWGASWDVLGSWRSAGTVRCDALFDVPADLLADAAPRLRSRVAAERRLGWRLTPAAERLPRDGGEVAWLAGALFGRTPAFVAGTAVEPANGTIADEIAEAAWADWWSRLARALGWPSAGEVTDASPSVTDPSLRPWSGALWLSIPLFDRVLELLLGGDDAEKLLGAGRVAASRPGAPLVPVHQAVAGRSVRLRATLRPVELDLGALADLRVEDVLRTPHGVEEPIHLSLEVDDAHPRSPLLRGAVGRVGGMRAIELLDTTPSAPQARDRSAEVSSR